VLPLRDSDKNAKLCEGHADLSLRDHQRFAAEYALANQSPQQMEACEARYWKDRSQRPSFSSLTGWLYRHRHQRRIEMLNIKHKAALFVARVASTLVLSLCVAATGALSASAHSGPAGISARDAQHVAGSFQRTNPRYVGYAGPGGKSWMVLPAWNATDDDCYLPTDKCDDYLSN
jgi:hypothetical protein